MEYIPIIGMEIHVELKTKSKMFCGCKNDPFHAPKPNIYTCPVCLGMPGGLPVANKKAIEWAIKLGLALGCEIPLFSKFDRKNYFYPDLSKGYQISQYDQPLAINGKLEIGIQSKKTIRIRRAHLEEDTGKLLHASVNGSKVSLIDFNRSGVPLVEIVTEPDIHSSDEAKEFLKKLHQIIKYLDISDAEMEKGSMRLEPNISLMKMPNAKLQISNSKRELPPYKVEVKNINSFNFVKKAIDFEIERHAQILDGGELPLQETRGWDEKKNTTVPQRRKETADDYRYFPDPDLPPMIWTKSEILNLKSQIPELPDLKLNRFIAEYKLPQIDAERLSETSEMAQYFEKSVKSNREKRKTAVSPIDIANWIINKKIDISKISEEELLNNISASKTVTVVDPKVLDSAITTVVTNNAKAVTDYKSGKATIIMFLVGQVMRELNGKADAQLIKKELERKLRTS
jgi:aspartyl-tRNA(Asn)/glutamyl-tRNA(Gln) amidotransferase subunit B